MLEAIRCIKSYKKIIRKFKKNPKLIIVVEDKMYKSNTKKNIDRCFKTNPNPLIYTSIIYLCFFVFVYRNHLATFSIAVSTFFSISDTSKLLYVVCISSFVGRFLSLVTNIVFGCPTDGFRATIHGPLYVWYIKHPGAISCGCTDPKWNIDWKKV